MRWESKVFEIQDPSAGAIASHNGAPLAGAVIDGEPRNAPAASVSAMDDGQPTAPPHRWASLADRLNPNRAAFDAQLKASWKSLSKVERKRIIDEDRRQIAALKARAKERLPFESDPNDHCETSPTAYEHIAPILELMAKRLHKKPEDLMIYDPYFCAGSVVRHLNRLGFGNVYNKREDFYKAIAERRVPRFDVLLTNPPYSGDHFDKLLKFLQDKDRPSLMLLPDYFSKKTNQYRAENYCFLNPGERYHYWTPEGMRPNDDSSKKRGHHNLMLGTRNSPFASHWYINMNPVMTNDELIKVVGDESESVTLAEGSYLYRTQEEIPKTNFKGTTTRDGNPRKKRGKKR